MEFDGTAALQLHLFTPPPPRLPYLVRAPSEFVDEAMAQMPPTEHDRTRLPPFLADWLTVDPGLGCWLWARGVTTGGYGQVWVPRSAGDLWTELANTPPGPKTVHRLVWHILVGPLEPGTVLDHQCERPRCCNPAHLKPTTINENSVRARKGRYQTHCKRGHLLPPPGDRVGGCRICTRVIAQARAAGLPHPDEKDADDGAR